MRRRRALLWAVALAITLGFGYLAVRNAHPDEVWRSLSSANAWWIFPALAVMAVSVAIRAVRWQYLFPPETRPPLGAVTSAMLVGLAANNLLPFRAGEALRIVALGRRTGTSKVEALATVAVERALDVFCLILLLLLALPWLPEVQWVGAAAVVALLLALVLGGAAVLFAVFGDRPFHVVERGLKRLPFVQVERMEHAAASLARGLVGLRHAGTAVTALVLTTLSWIVLSVSFWLLTLGFHLDVPPVAGILVLAAVGFSVVLPAAPSAIGVFEAATVVALAAYGIGASTALSYAVMLHAINLAPYLVAGALALRFTRPPR